MNATGEAPSIFESFSARYLAPEQVAETFVPSEHFDTLTQRSHTLIVGPRGSGKTTLLKMLQGRALTGWKHKLAAKYRNQIDYTGVFIPTDVTWSRQLDHVGTPYLSKKESELLARAAFTTHVLHNLLDAMHFRVRGSAGVLSPFRRATMPKGGEAEFAHEVAKNLYIDNSVPNIAGLKRSLMARMGKIIEIASEEKLRGVAGRSRRLGKRKLLHIDFFQAAVHAIEVFDDIISQPGSRWALSFDELELAPTHIVKALVGSLRSADHRILLKLSFSPFNRDFELLKDALSSMPGHDFKYVPLWYESKNDGHRFSLSLFDSMMAERGMVGISPRDVFGASEFEPDLEQKEIRTERLPINTNHEKLFKTMHATDASFRNYLETNNIDVNRLAELSESDRARYVRKIYNVLAIRHTYRAPDEQRSRRRLRAKSWKAYPKIYSGAKTLFDMLEGNPRWFIGAVGPLLDEFVATSTRVPHHSQLSQVRKIAHQFRSLLSAIPCSVQTGNDTPKSITNVLKEIGDHIYKSVVLDRFQPEPRGSFTVDQKTSHLEEGLSLALNAGAIVYVSGGSADLVLRSLYKKRFRITYLLAPHFKIPVQLLREKGLSDFLDDSQLQLFGDTGDATNSGSPVVVAPNIAN